MTLQELVNYMSGHRSTILAAMCNAEDTFDVAYLMQKTGCSENTVRAVIQILVMARLLKQSSPEAGESTEKKSGRVSIRYLINQKVKAWWSKSEDLFSSLEKSLR